MFKWLGNFFKSRDRNSDNDDNSINFSSSENEIINNDYDYLKLAGIAANYTLNKTSEMASNTYNYLSEVDYPYYAERGYIAASYSANYLSYSLGKLCEGGQNLINMSYNLVYGSNEKLNFDDYKPVKNKTSNDPNNVENSNDNEFNGDFEHICGVCLDREKNRVLFPCGHTYCNVCTSGFTTCPNCRSAINGTMKFYL